MENKEVNINTNPSYENIIKRTNRTSPMGILARAIRSPLLAGVHLPVSSCFLCSFVKYQMKAAATRMLPTFPMMSSIIIKSGTVTLLKLTGVVS